MGKRQDTHTCGMSTLIDLYNHSQHFRPQHLCHQLPRSSHQQARAMVWRPSQFVPTHLSKHIPFRFPPPAAVRTSDSAPNADQGAPDAGCLPMPSFATASRPHQPRMPPPTHLCGITPARPATKMAAAPVRNKLHPPPLPPPPKRQEVELKSPKEEKEAPMPNVEGKEKELSPTSQGTTLKAVPGQTFEIPLQKKRPRLGAPPKKPRLGTLPRKEPTKKNLEEEALMGL